MKHYLILILSILVYLSVHAQSPQSFQYQAVVRDASGSVLASHSVAFQLSVISGSPTGTVEYIETHNSITNEFGIVTLSVGSGTPQLNLFSNIMWGSDLHFLKVEADPDGNGFVDMGTTQLLSVPYALWAAAGNQGAPGINGLSINWLGTFASAPASPNVNDVYYNSTNKQSHIWDGSSWNIMTKDGIDGTNGISITWLGTYAVAPVSPLLNNAYYNSADKKSYMWDGTVWQVLSIDGVAGAQGPAGPAGTGLNNRGNWSNGATYSNGDYVFDRSTGSALINSMWICQTVSFTSTIQPYLDAVHWVEFQAPAGPAGTNGSSIIWLGTLASAPASPNVNDAYYNNIDKKSYIWNGSLWNILAQDGLPANYNAGTGIGIIGDVISNTQPDQIVTLNNGTGVTVTGVYPTYTITNSSPNATHTGDVTGTTALTIATNAVTTSKIQDGNVTAAKLNSMSATNGQVLKFNGTNWAPANDASNTYTGGTGITLNGSAFDAQTTTALWNANQLQGRSIASTAPTSGQVLSWNGTNWVPANDQGVTSAITSLNGLTGSTQTFSTGTTGTDFTISSAGSIHTFNLPIANSTNTGKLSNTDWSTFNNKLGTSLNAGNMWIGNASNVATSRTMSGDATISNVGVLTIANNAVNGAKIAMGSDANGDVMYYNGTDYTRLAAGSNGTVLKVSGGIPAWGTDNNSGTPGGLNKTIQYNNSGVFAGDTSLVWDNTNKRLGVGLTSPSGRVVIQGSTAALASEPLFEVKNRSGQSVMVVYEDSVHFFITDAANPSNRGGFAVSGRSNAKAGAISDYFNVTPDSTRIYLNDDALNGGFSVQGINGTALDNYFSVSVDTNEVIDPAEDRIMWYPTKSAFLAGKVLIESKDSVGYFSMATGYKSKAIGDWSQALGYRARAFGLNSTAIGNYANAKANNSFAVGDSSVAKGKGSFAFGSKGLDTLTGAPTMMQTVANGDHSFAFGFGSYAHDFGSFALGAEAAAMGKFSMALGLYDTTYADFSYAIGLRSITRGKYSCALGTYNDANGEGSFAFGSGNKSTSNGSFSIGTACYSSGSGSIAFGVEDTSSGSGAIAFGYRTVSSNLASTSFGSGSKASGIVSTAFGNNTKASGMFSTSFGAGTTALSMSSTALGSGTTASNTAATAMGNTTVASGISSTSMGYATVASGNYSTSFGNTTSAIGTNSMTIGQGISASGDYSLAIALNDQTGTIVTTSNVMSVMGGNLGIGTIAPARALHVSATSAPAARFRRSDDGTLIEFYSGILMQGSISIAGAVTSYNAFTGSHYAKLNEKPEKGVLVNLNGNNSYLNNDQNSEIIYGCDISQKANSPDILGAYLGDEDFDGKNSPSLIMAVGNGVMWVVDNGENLKIGDYLISSSTKGNAMKDKGDFEVANIIARVAESVDWNNVTTMIDGKKHKLISVFYENFTMNHNENKIKELTNRIESLEQIIKSSVSK